MTIVHRHTPGPWHIKNRVPVTGSSGHTGDMFSIGSKFLGVAYAATNEDARLIAASPRLLDATKHLVREIEFLIEEGSLPQSAADHPSMILARQAIASADGSAA